MNSQNNNDNNFNIILAMVLIFAVLWSWEYFKEKPQDHSTISASNQNKQKESDATVNSNHNPIKNNYKKLTNSFVAINTNKVKGRINLQGGRIDKLSLLKYNKNVDGLGGKIAILSPADTEEAYFVDFRWKSVMSTIQTPDENIIWNNKNGNSLTVATPVTLTWENGQGVKFTRTVSIDDDYLITVNDSVRNNSEHDVSLFTHSTISRKQLKEVSSFFILHEGPIGYLADKLIEIKYDDLNSKHKKYESKGGWLGITDKYWLTAILPEQNTPIKASYGHYFDGKDNIYLTDCLSPEITIKSNSETSYKQHLFVGPKVLQTLDGYEVKLGVKHFDLAVDFGWFYLLTKPIFNILTMAKEYLGNFGLGILLLTVILKLICFPLANKSYRSMAKMKKLQPKMLKLREMYQDDKIRLNQEIMALYKKEKVNPMAGCLPMVVQIPVFFALYKVLFISIEMRHAPFFGWITDLSAPDPTTIFNLFGLIAWTPPSMLQIGALPLFMGATMILQQKLNPAPADPMQEKMFMIMPVVFTVMLSSFPSGLVIYWAWNNVLTIAQQWTIMRMSSK